MAAGVGGRRRRRVAPRVLECRDDQTKEEGDLASREGGVK
jgi:hypothetical protein